MSLIFPKFARKEFECDINGETETYSALGHRKELKNLAILNHLKHPNIVQLLGSYTYDGKHSLLFPLADTGNLAELLATERQSTRFTSDESLVVALAGLSSAVEHVHNFTERKIDLELIGCHNDLRPRNVLVSKSKFLLADFGLSTFKPLSQNSATEFKNGNNDDYLAPECEDWECNFQAGTVHRSNDIWSLGCIAADVATYMARGHEGIDNFRRAREHRVRGFILNHFHEGPRQPSKAVEHWLSELESISTRACSLLVCLVRQILRIDPSERPNAKEVTSRLRLVATYEVAGTVNDLFRLIRGNGDSLDMFLEHTRFDAWRYAINILNLENEPIPPYKTIHDAMSRFDAILGCLTRLRGVLESRLPQAENTQRLNFSPLLELNDELHCFLDQEQKTMSREYFNVTVMEGDSKLFERFEDGDASLVLNHEIRMRANIKHVNNLLARDCGSASRALEVKPSLFEQGERFGDNHLGRVHDSQPPRTVWVEWRNYGRHGADEHTIGQLCDRAARLAELLSQERPEAFRTLRCNGFFHEPGKAAFGIIFELPLSAVPTRPLKPTSLCGLIQETTNHSKQWPDLNDRFKLALSLAASVLELHTVGWFHKALTTSHVVFFQETDGAKGQLVREPFLVGFNHSRPDEPFAFTSGLTDSSSRDYQHPTYLKEGFGYRPEFDYYSLGMILMEIGFWKPLSEIMNRPQYRGLSYKDRCDRLLADRVPLLKQHMGREYYEAVRWCIQCGSSESKIENPGGKSMLLRFGELVVARLRGCFG